ncbi:hypothetical protein [Streptomyces olivaceoviridis]|uniref:hypothetical protein n=1 Tax=Streptomyces olivaceoviridis TaxID=1921 RepID=UPI0037AF667F
MEAVSVLDSALHQGLLSQPDLVTIPAHLSGRRNARRARDWLRLTDARAESPLETRVRLICLDDGLSPPLLQWHVPDSEQGFSYRIDLGWPAQLVGVEADGKHPHSTPQALYRDRYRQNRLATLLPAACPCSASPGPTPTSRLESSSPSAQPSNTVLNYPMRGPHQRPTG